jgi:hypothetical protein
MLVLQFFPFDSFDEEIINDVVIPTVMDFFPEADEEDYDPGALKRGAVDFWVGEKWGAKNGKGVFEAPE